MLNVSTLPRRVTDLEVCKHTPLMDSPSCLTTQKGQQHMISSAPGQPGKPMPGQPQQQQQYVITSQGQLQIPPGQTQMPPVNLMLAPPGMPSGMQVSMSGQPGQPPVMKTSDGKPE